MFRELITCNVRTVNGFVNDNVRVPEDNVRMVMMQNLKQQRMIGRVIVQVDT
jgi:hypothetical protein